MSSPQFVNPFIHTFEWKGHTFWLYPHLSTQVLNLVVERNGWEFKETVGAYEPATNLVWALKIPRFSSGSFAIAEGEPVPEVGTNPFPLSIQPTYRLGSGSVRQVTVRWLKDDGKNYSGVGQLTTTGEWVFWSGTHPRCELRAIKRP